MRTHMSRICSLVSVHINSRYAEIDFLDLSEEEVETRFEALLNVLRANSNTEIIMEGLEKTGWYPPECISSPLDLSVRMCSGHDWSLGILSRQRTILSRYS